MTGNLKANYFRMHYPNHHGSAINKLHCPKWDGYEIVPPRVVGERVIISAGFTKTLDLREKASFAAKALQMDIGTDIQVFHNTKIISSIHELVRDWYLFSSGSGHQSLSRKGVNIAYIFCIIVRLRIAYRLHFSNI